MIAMSILQERSQTHFLGGAKNKFGGGAAAPEA